VRSEQLLVFAPAPAAPEPLRPFAGRCPCCGLRGSLSALGDVVLCAGHCVPCGGSCLGVLQREAAPAAPPLAERPVEDFNWVMRN
jgi:hypothetical protein